MAPIYLKDTQKYGRGIYAKRDIKKGEQIEVSPIIMISKEDWQKYLEKTILYSYCFYWEENLAIALGYGSLFNHSYHPNARFYNNMANLSIDFYAIRDIKKDEEITINYHGDPEDDSPLWFDVIE
ncbi:MAG: SET domain-containing protein [Bacillota bacterium]|nr:SET domain-containing protein [Bacillota bacterium]MDP4155506.1 SET domain-containing protein [Bacillota bacterium]